MDCRRIAESLKAAERDLRRCNDDAEEREMRRNSEAHDEYMRKKMEPKQNDRR